MQEVYRLISQAIETDVTVLIIGETGTGKELTARAIHYCGARKLKTENGKRKNWKEI